MSLRVHLPRDFGLGVLTVGGALSLADALRMELGYRRMSDRELARRVGKSHSTLGNYLRGERPFPPELLEAVLAVLHEQGPFGIPTLAEARVIPSLEEPPGAPTWASSDPHHTRRCSGAWVDTVWANVDVPVEWQPSVLAHLEREHERVGRGHPAVRHGDRHAFALSPWGQDERAEGSSRPIASTRGVGGREKDWLRVQLKASDPAQYAAYGDIVHPLTFGRPPGCVRLKRIDFCCDYPVDPTWLVVQRARARHYEWMSSSNGVHTIAVGKRGSSRYYLRCYDAAAVHGLPAPHTRVELEWRPERGLTWGDFGATFDNPFREVFVGTLTAATLTPREITLLQLARGWGLTAFRKTLDAGDRRLLDGAVAKLKAAPRLRPDRDLDNANWTYLRPILRGLFGE